VEAGVVEVLYDLIKVLLVVGRVEARGGDREGPGAWPLPWKEILQ